MDLNTLKQEAAQDDEAVTVTITDKAGDPYTPPFTVDVVGRYSSRVRAAQQENQRRMLRRRKAKLEPEDVTENRVHVAAAAIVRWQGPTAAGQPLDCTAENAKAILSAAPWILDQVEAAIDGHADFFGKR